MARKENPPREALATLTRQIAGLQSKTVNALALQYEQLAGEPTRSRNKVYLIKRVAFLLQEQASGGLSKTAELKIAELGAIVPAEWRARIAAPAPAPAPEQGSQARDPRLPPAGHTLEKPYKGRLYKVAILETGFELDGKTYKTLTDVARVITGRHVSGFRFFGFAK